MLLYFPTHHSMLVGKYYFPKCWTKSTMLEVWYYSLAEFDCAVELLDFVDWDSLLPHDEVNTYWSAWKNYLKSCRFAVFLTVW